MTRHPRCAIIALMLTLGMAGCSNDDAPTIVGHWRAERARVFSALIPIGPDIVVSEHDITSPDSDVHIPISIETKHNEAVLDFSYGVGLSFYFEGADRMYVEVPLVGKIYYQRVKDIPRDTAVAAVVPVSPPTRGPVATDPPPRAENAAAVQKDVVPAAAPLVAQAEYEALMRRAEVSMNNGQLDKAEALLMVVQKEAGAHPSVDYDLAVLKMRESDSDAAIHHLNDAFRYGFRRFDLLDANVVFAPLEADVRYSALLSRYR